MVRYKDMIRVSIVEDLYRLLAYRESNCISQYGGIVYISVVFRKMCFFYSNKVGSSQRIIIIFQYSCFLIYADYNYLVFYMVFDKRINALHIGS